MKIAYTEALISPREFELDCFKKYETVKGIIGNIQGVNRAKKPPKNPKRKILK